MKRGVLAGCVAALTALQALSPNPAHAGDPQAHTAAMVMAAAAVAEEFEDGVGAPEFKLDLPSKMPDGGRSDELSNAQCWACGINAPGCAESCWLGKQINAPDHWACDDPAQPEALSTLNSQASIAQVFSAKVAGDGAIAAGRPDDVDKLAMACNYTHFANNGTPAGLSAGDAELITIDWAEELLTTIVDRAGEGEIRCDRTTFRKYVGRVVNALHFAQDGESEHHVTGNLFCRTDEKLPSLLRPDFLIDFSEVDGCRAWLEAAMKRADDVCDDAVAQNKGLLWTLCKGGSPLACTGLERLLHHHCDLEGDKTIGCGGKESDHHEVSAKRGQKPRTYCEGERFDGGGQDFIAAAAAVTESNFRIALNAWAKVCGKPTPCEQDACELYCRRTSSVLSGFCVNTTDAGSCKLDDCVCEEHCGKLGQPCCQVEDSKCFEGECSAGSGRCVQVGSAPACPGDPGSSGGTGGTTGNGPGNGGNGGDDGSDGGASNPGSAGNDGGPTGGTGGTTHGPPRRQYPGKKVKDPHLLTFDGLTYDLQAVGEFTAVRDASDGMEVQTRTKAYGSSTLISVVVGAAARVGSDRVAFYLGAPSTLNGVETEFSPDGTTLPDGGLVYRLPSEHVVVWPDGTQLSVGVAPACLNVELYLPAARHGNVAGLLGGFDGSLTNELLTRDGGSLPSPVDFETFYGVFAESWRIAQPDSLLDYGPGEDTETYTNRSFPYWLLRAQDLDAASADHAAQVCAAAGITDPFWVDACILDVGATGDDGFADQYASFLPPKAALEILPPRVSGASNGGGLGSAPVRSGTLGAGDEVFYSFAAKAGEGIQLRAADVGNGPFTPRLEVFDANGTLVSNNYNADVAYASFNAGSSGTFTVVVSDASGRTDVIAGYDLYFFKGPGSNEGGALLPGTFAADTVDKGDLDSYTFTAAEGEAVQLRLVDLAGGAFVPSLVVYGPTGAVVSSNYNTNVAYASFNAPATGTYTVLVHDWSTGAAATGDYELHYVKAPGAAEHGVLLPGTSVTETIDKGDLDSYTFTAAQGEGIQLRVADVAGGAFVPSLVIYGPTGTVVSSNYNTDVAYASFNAPAAGTYTVLVHDWSSGAAGSGDYELHYVKAPGAAEHGALTPGSVVSGTIEKGDLDSFTFTANAGEGVQLRVADLTHGSFVPSLVVYGPTGTVVSSNYNTDVAYASFAAPAAGTYTVLVHDWSSGAAGAGDYDLHFAKAPGANEGGSLTPGSPVTASIDLGDLDSYTFTTTAGTAIDLSMVDLGATAFTPAFAVYNPTGGVVGSNYGADLAHVAFAAPVTGTYTVMTYDWSSGLVGAGSYSLALQ